MGGGVVIRNLRKGAASTLELLIVSGLLLFFILAPVAYYNLNVNYMSSVSVFNTTLQTVSVCGGYDERVEEQLYLNLLARGLIDANGSDDVGSIITNDKSRPSNERQVRVECSSHQINGDSPIYRAYSMGVNSGISLRVSFRQTNAQKFLAAALRLVGVQSNSMNGYFELTGYVMSQLPKPA